MSSVALLGTAVLTPLLAWHEWTSYGADAENGLNADDLKFRFELVAEGFAAEELHEATLVD